MGHTRTSHACFVLRADSFSRDGLHPGGVYLKEERYCGVNSHGVSLTESQLGIFRTVRRVCVCVCVSVCEFSAVANENVFLGYRGVPPPLGSSGVTL